MKPLLILIQLFELLSSFGQVSTKGHDEWDSLFIRNKIAIQRYENILRKELRYTDTSRTKGSITITYFSGNKMKLQRVEQTFDSNNCAMGIFHQYYNDLGLVVYAIGYKKCCPEENQNDEKCFERVTDYARFEYDDKNRIAVHVFHLTAPLTYKETCKYDADGTKQVNRVKIPGSKFWE
jgi:hypothetical protein